MKRLAMLALAASAAAFAMPAAAQTVTGTVNIIGNVPAKCTVQPGGGSTFGTTVDLLDLSQANGTLESSATLAARFGTQGGSALSVKVMCTTANPTIAVNANAITSGNPTAAGYDNSIDFDADVTVVRVAGSQVYSNDSNDPPGTATALGSPLANSANNVTIATSDFHTDNPGDILVAGTDYAGSIVVTIAPN